FMFMCFSKTPALSKTGDAKPFDGDGDGTILGEGLGIVVLRRLADAERDGDRVYAVLKAIGSSSDGKGDAVYAPSAHPPAPRPPRGKCGRCGTPTTRPESRPRQSSCSRRTGPARRSATRWRRRP